MGAAGIAVAVCLGIFILWSIYVYNAFRDRQYQIDFWWDEVDAHLQLRRELIPSLLDRARPLMGPQASTLEKIAGIREEIVLGFKAASTQDAEEEGVERLENRLSAEMHSLQSAFRENREIQMNPSLLTVMGELVSIEGKAVNACKEYNKLTADYNGQIRKFPANLIAGSLHFSPREKRIFGEWDEPAMNGA
ncbi:MAG: LemA family protein [Synergistaceae bacterium]|nr:LemA family protein [Synergistaceae bacterium]